MIIGSFGNDEGDRNENVKKQKQKQNDSFIEEYNKFAFVYISLPSLHDYDVKIPNFTFYGGF